MFERKGSPIIKHADPIWAHSLLWHEGSTWVKKDEKNFDIAQGNYDGAESSDLIALFLLDKLKGLEEMDAGLHRDDMLGVTELEGEETGRMKQKISNIFKTYGLKVKVEVNKK